MKTQQEIFDQVWTGLKSQGFKRSVEQYNGDCMYRSYYNEKCAIGWLIPDDKYDIDMEHEHISYLFENFDLKDIIDFGDGAFLLQLQMIHDRCDEPNSMELKYRQFAVKYDLTIPEGN